MPKLIAPLFSMEAWKTLKKTLTYQRHGSGHAVYKYHKPGGKSPFVPSATQRDKRMLFNMIIARWQTLTDDERNVYNDLVKNQGLPMSGWNWFYKESLKNLTKYLGLVGYWSFNRIVNGEILDISGQGNNLSLGPNYPVNAPVLENSISPKYGQAGSFDGDDYCSHVAVVDLEPATAITVEAWVQFASVPSVLATIVDKGSQTDNTHYWLYFHDTTGFSFEVGNGIARVLVTYVITPVVGTWYHVVGTYTSGSLKIYVNGVLGATITTFTGNLVNDYNPFVIGSYRRTYYFWNGLIDEVRIYNRVLGSVEIKKLYHLSKI